MMSVCWISFSLSVLMIAFLSSAAGQGAVQDEYIGNIVSLFLLPRMSQAYFYTIVVLLHVSLVRLYLILCIQTVELV